MPGPHSPHAAGTGPNATAPQGLLHKVSAADTGVIDRPVLTPHLEYRILDEERVLLVSESFNTLLHGPLHGPLLALLDGQRTHDEIAEALGTQWAGQDPETVLKSLAARGYLVSGDYCMARERAAWWSALGASPRFVEECLGSAGVSVAGDEGRALIGALESLGVAVDSMGRELRVVVCEDYLDAAHADTNRVQMDSGQPWMLARPKGTRPLIGPVFRPGTGGPCWNCLAYRLQNHQEVHTFVRNREGEAGAFRAFAAEPGLLGAVHALIATEIAKWLIFAERAPIHSNAITLELGPLKTQSHPVRRRPQCLVCGEQEHYRADRPARAVQLKPSPKDVQNSGGLRAVHPEQTLARYRHLISPVSGVVSWLERTTEVSDPWLHVHWAGSNLALRIKSLSSLRRSLRSKSAGKGSTPEQSQASALCEAIERYSGAYLGDEIRTRKRYSEFEGQGEDRQAIHPNKVQLFSDHQLEHADEINARAHPYKIIPPRFDAEAEIDWSPVYSLTRARHRYLPTSILYGMTPEQRGPGDLWADSNGCAGRQHAGGGHPAGLSGTGGARCLLDLVVQPSALSARRSSASRRRLPGRCSGLLPNPRARHVAARHQRRFSHPGLRGAVSQDRHATRRHPLRSRRAHRCAHRRLACGVRDEPVPDLGPAPAGRAHRIRGR